MSNSIQYGLPAHYIIQNNYVIFIEQEVNAGVVVTEKAALLFSVRITLRLQKGMQTRDTLKTAICFQTACQILDASLTFHWQTF